MAMGDKVGMRHSFIREYTCKSCSAPLIGDINAYKNKGEFICGACHAMLLQAEFRASRAKAIRWTIRKLEDGCLSV